MGVKSTSLLEEKRIAIILPAYNEEDTIEGTIRDFQAYLPQASIFIINNNSKDQTAAVARRVLKELGCEGDVVEENRQGKGNAVRRAFLDIDADIYVLADADMTYPASRVHDLIDPVLRGNADMVVGDRHSKGHYAKENKRALHGFGNTLVQRLVNLTFHSNLTDIMSGYRVFNRAFVKSYPILVEGFQIETDMTLHALHKRLRICEIPVEYKDRPAGSFSKLNTFSDGTRVLISIFQILRYFRPFVFFSGVALFCALLGLISAIPVMDDWIRERYIHHVPLAILASALEIVAFLMFGIGLILDALVHQQRMDFEMSLLNQEKKELIDAKSAAGMR
ncbi:MAG: glycosyltransferase [Sphingobacteriales bacterium]|nr:MAG: glycosyltransferase [Sphingobacteriales bacterium]